jgi:Fe-S cluster biogenesis protein NfuA
MFIQTEQTPNPATLKFLPGQTILESGSVDFQNGEEAQDASPLASRLFEIEGVSGVFFGADFISITKAKNKEWFVLKPSILGVIMEHLSAAQPIMNEGAEAVRHAQGDDDEIVAQIKELLDTRVRPAVAQDGGDIVFHGFEEGIVYLTMRGACAGCPSSSATLKVGIENMLRHYIPEVIEVRQS